MRSYHVTLTQILYSSCFLRTQTCKEASLLRYINSTQTSHLMLSSQLRRRTCLSLQVGACVLIWHWLLLCRHQFISPLLIEARCLHGVLPQYGYPTWQAASSVCPTYLNDTNKDLTFKLPQSPDVLAIYHLKRSFLFHPIRLAPASDNMAHLSRSRTCASVGTRASDYKHCISLGNTLLLATTSKV